MRQTKTVRSKAPKNHMTGFEQLQQIKNTSKTFVAQFQQKFITPKKNK